LSGCPATIIERHSSLSYFNFIKKIEIDAKLEALSELTVFLPVDSAWESLHPIERLYLESEFAADDLLRILNSHAVGQKNVIWSESFDPGVNRRS
jgi:solute carrier family 25 carnitine/acylcarnitine transporter 20/29